MGGEAHMHQHASQWCMLKRRHVVEACAHCPCTLCMQMSWMDPAQIFRAPSKSAGMQSGGCAWRWPCLFAKTGGFHANSMAYSYWPCGPLLLRFDVATMQMQPATAHVQQQQQQQSDCERTRPSLICDAQRCSCTLGLACTAVATRLQPADSQ